MSPVTVGAPGRQPVSVRAHRTNRCRLMSRFHMDMLRWRVRRTTICLCRPCDVVRSTILRGQELNPGLPRDRRKILTTILPRKWMWLGRNQLRGATTTLLGLRVRVGSALCGCIRRIHPGCVSGVLNPASVYSARGHPSRQGPSGTAVRPALF